MRRPKPLVPLVPSASIPDGRYLTPNDLIGSAQLGLKPMINASRTLMEDAIRDGRLVAPTIKLNSRFICWDSSVIKTWVAQREREMEAQP